MPAPVKQDVHKRKVGRPGWVPSEQDLDQIQALAQRGVPKMAIASRFNFHYGYWNELERRFPEILERYNKGFADSHARAFDHLQKRIEEKSDKMLTWYLNYITGQNIGANTLTINQTNIQNQTTNIQINFEKLNKDELKSLAQQCTLLLDSDHEKKD